MIEREVGEGLRKSGISISVAESCTGGLLSHRITNVAGSSLYFKGGVIAYSNEAKEGILRVSRRTIEEKGAISEECAEEMAEGVRKLFETDIGVAITGIAGPDRSDWAPDRDKPVGLVYIAVATGERIYKEKFLFHEDREGNKREAVEAALKMIKKYVL
ncbi:MAG: CinA family protein [Candidatus Methanospirareceae archaeon]